MSHVTPSLVEVIETRRILRHVETLLVAVRDADCVTDLEYQRFRQFTDDVIDLDDRLTALIKAAS